MMAWEVVHLLVLGRLVIHTRSWIREWIRLDILNWKLSDVQRRRGIDQGGLGDTDTEIGLSSDLLPSEKKI